MTFTSSFIIIIIILNDMLKNKNKKFFIGQWMLR